MVLPVMSRAIRAEDGVAGVAAIAGGDESVNQK